MALMDVHWGYVPHAVSIARLQLAKPVEQLFSDGYTTPHGDGGGAGLTQTAIGGWLAHPKHLCVGHSYNHISDITHIFSSITTPKGRAISSFPLNAVAYITCHAHLSARRSKGGEIWGHGVPVNPGGWLGSQLGWLCRRPGPQVLVGL